MSFATCSTDYQMIYTYFRDSSFVVFSREWLLVIAISANTHQTFIVNITITLIIDDTNCYILLCINEYYPRIISQFVCFYFNSFWLLQYHQLIDLLDCLQERELPYPPPFLDIKFRLGESPGMGTAHLYFLITASIDLPKPRVPWLSLGSLS